MSSKHYDVAIIGGGIGGLMAAYRLHRNLPGIRVVITERGNTLEKRHCPAGKNNTCVHCKHCSITSGFAGAGAFSDGKFNLGTAYGGTLGEELGDDVVNEACDGLNILHTETLGRQKSCVVRVPAETMAAKGLDVDCTSLPLQKVFVALCGHEQELQEHREG